MELTECLAALEWHIPLDKWWSMPRWLRALHVATIEARERIIRYHTEDKQ